MTIVIAVLCNNKKSIIFVSDRMLTFENDFLETESLNVKYRIFHNQIILGTAGNATKPIELFEELSNYSETLFQDFFKACESFKDIYAEKRTQAVEENILRHYGLSFNEFKASQETLFDTLTKNLWEEISEFDYDVEVLLAGMDKKKGHLAVISDPGICQYFDDIGYAAIGGGAHFASVSLAGERYDIRYPVHRALISIYFAKKMAERVPGVGTETDIVILHKEKVSHLSPEKKRALDELYQEHQKILLRTLTELAESKKAPLNLEEKTRENSLMINNYRGGEKAGKTKAEVT